MTGRTCDEVRRALTQEGLALPPVTPPLAAYQPAVRTTSTIYTAGQLPMRDGSLTHTGQVGAGGLSAAEGAAAAGVAALAAIAAACSVATEQEALRPVKVTVFVAAADGFHDLPQVADGASAVFAAAFAEPHARSAVGVRELPRGASVEVEAIFAVLPPQ
ncbi:MAG: hypothetical protein QG597_2796 [Actinomycetota bacterium]|nr:hypothetical protein [Actinomycetota bacterium]